MSFYDVAQYACLALVIAAVLYFPRKIGARQRLRVGSILFVVGWAGILAGLRFSYLPVLQSEAVAYAWTGLFALAIVVATIFLVTAFFDWLGLTRPRRHR